MSSNKSDIQKLILIANVIFALNGWIFYLKQIYSLSLFAFIISFMLTTYQVITKYKNQNNK